MNLAEKLIQSHLLSGTMEPGTEIGLRIDQTLTQDATGTMAYLEFEAMGIERARLAMWENGYAWPSAAFLPKMADLLCCTIDELYHVPEESDNEQTEG